MYDNGQLINLYLENLMTLEEKKNNTIASYYYDLSNFYNWNLANSNLNWSEVDHNYINAYLNYRYEQGIHVNAVSRCISTLRSFYQYLLVNDYIDNNPLQQIVIPKRIKSNPIYLDQEQMQVLLDQPNLKSNIGLRDRAMLEILYSSGLRISELVNLTFNEIDFSHGLLRIYGKGGKTRIVPISHSALYYLNHYLVNFRYQLDSLSDFVFTNKQGKPMTRNNFWLRVNKYAQVLDIDLNGFGPHSIRHSFATHMLNNGADIRTVQVLLGHSSLMATQIYTHIANDKLKNLHTENPIIENQPYEQLLDRFNQNFLQFKQSKE